MSDISDYSGVLCSLAAAYESKLENLSDIRDITLELKNAIEDEEEGIADEPDDFDLFNEILDKRGIVIEQQKIIMTTIRHYESQLPQNMLDLINSAELGANEEKGFGFISAIKEIFGAEKIISADIQAAENFNLLHMKKLMDDIKKKLDNIKKNRIIMDKFIVGDSDIKTGALINKKK